MNDFYNFKLDGQLSTTASAQSLVHIINLQGKNLLCAEVGVFKALNLCFLLQSCPNIKTMHAVDSYQPYTDYLSREPKNSKPMYSISQRNIEDIRMVSFHNQKWSGFQDKIVFHEEDSEITAKKFNDELDFVFLDSYMSYKQVYQDLVSWYPTLKQGGIFSGHDSTSPDVVDAIKNFCLNNNLEPNISYYDNCWIWIK